MRFNELQSAGLTNSTVGDLRDLIKNNDQHKLSAYCTSDKCCSKVTRVLKVSKKSGEKYYQQNVIRVHRTEKEVSSDEKQCPDCGYYLYWNKKIINL